MARLPADNTRKVLDTVQAFPEGVRTSEVITLLQDIPRKNITHALSNLRHWGCVSTTLIERVNNNGKEYRYFYVKSIEERDAKPGRIAEVVAALDARTTLPRSRETTVGEKAAELMDEVGTLKAQLATLEAWKADAIKKHPDLAVAPEIVRARELVAKIFRNKGEHDNANAVEAGRRDSTAIMLAVLEAQGDT